MRYSLTLLIYSILGTTLSLCSCSGVPEILARPVTGQFVPELASFDQFMLDLLQEHKIPGGALCISRHGKIVYARGFGWADLDQREAVAPESLFRIASISKPLTGMAIARLVEAGDLELNANPYEYLGLTQELADAADPRLKQITIEQLLQHTVGWDRDQTFYPMFEYARVAKAMGVNSPPEALDIIRYMSTQKLPSDPGERYAYSNFGYCILGRVIEKATGESYEDHLKKLLAKIGISRMQIGRSLPEAQVTGEVTYYDPKRRNRRPVRAPGRKVPLPYCHDQEVMDSHGAWIASAVDLIRFANAFNDSDNCPFVSEQTYAQIFAPPHGLPGHDENGKVKAHYYGFGWDVRPVGSSGKANHWHGGLLSGTSTLLVRRHDGISWAILFNTDRSPEGRWISSIVDSMLHRVANEIEAWPTEAIR